MAQRDSAFLWETEALRVVPHPVSPPTRKARRADGDWVTLRQASEVTGVPVATLRKWALRGGVPSYLTETEVGQLRMVSLEGVYELADELGRTVTRGAPPVREKSADSTESPVRTQPDVPEGTMLVPLDAWTKVLNQLGNLHEAGQQLAEARERAAKAETEAAFLRERLAELRSQLDTPVPEPPSSTPPTQPPPKPPTRRSPWSAVGGVWTAIRRPRKP